jgi:hypothetical protein
LTVFRSKYTEEDVKDYEEFGEKDLPALSPLHAIYVRGFDSENEEIIGMNSFGIEHEEKRITTD